ncbi:MAG: TetR family transcriptional regulator C-terminal domain-containing protein [Actinomycetota bacterium]
MKKPTVAERRTEILEVTCEVVIDRGFAGTRISDVAKRLEVSSSLIHYHFDSKEQLLAEAFAHYARKDLAEMEGEIKAAPTALAQLDSAIQNYVPEGSDDMEWMLWIDGWGEALRNPMMKRISQELDEQTSGLLVGVLEAGVASGEFHCASPAASAMRLTALVDGLAVQFAAHDGMMNRDQLIDHVRTVAAAEVGLTLAHFDGVGSGATVADVVATAAGAPGASTEAALRQLVARHSDAVVQADPEAWLSTWTDDATWELQPGKVLSGRIAIGEAWVAAMKPFAWVVQSPAVAVFEADDSSGNGSGRVTVSEVFRRKRGGQGTMLGTYHDEYRRVDGRWLFSSRRLHVIDRS